MVIEVSPSEIMNGMPQVYTAKFIRETIIVAEITDAPHEIVMRWAEVIRDLHDGEPEIVKLGICHYCGSTKRNDVFCGDCDRVLR